MDVLPEQQEEALAADAEAGQVVPRPLPRRARHGHGRVVGHRGTGTATGFLAPEADAHAALVVLSPDDEPEDFVVTEIQRIARGKFQRKSIVEAKLTAADELQRLKTEYDAKLAALKQHEEEMRRCTRSFGRSTARSSTRGTGRAFEV